MFLVYTHLPYLKVKGGLYIFTDVGLVFLKIYVVFPYLWKVI